MKHADTGNNIFVALIFYYQLRMTQVFDGKKFWWISWFKVSSIKFSLSNFAIEQKNLSASLPVMFIAHARVRTK